MGRGVYNQTGRGPYRYTAPVWKASIAVSPGDFVYRDSSGYDQPVGNFTWDTNIATTSGEATTAFRGVSTARRFTSGSNQTVDGGRGHGGIIQSGEFQSYLDATATAIQAASSFVAFAKASGNNIDNQKISLTATKSNAIGRLTEDVRIGDTMAVWELEPYRGPWAGVQVYYDNSAIQTVGVTATAPTG